MATDTVPAAVPMPPEPPTGTPAATNTTDAPQRGLLASMVAAVEPARPTAFDITPTTGTAAADAGDGVVDRSTPGLSSDSFRDADQAAAKDPAGARRKAQGSIWKAWWLAGAQRWGKGGGTANKRLDLRKAKAQAHQVKESRTTTVSNSGGLPVRNSIGAGGGSKGSHGKPGPNGPSKGPVNSSGNRSGGSGRGGSGGGRGPGGGSGRHGAGGGAGKDADRHSKSPAPKGPNHGGGKGPAGSGGANGAGSAGKNSGHSPAKHSGGHDTKHPKTTSDKNGKGFGAGGSGKQGASGKSGAPGKDGKPGGTGGSGPNAKGPANASGKDTGKQVKGKKTDGTLKDTRTPLEKSREIGHKDGSNVRNVVDHVKAYADGARDGYRDKKDANAKDHERLDKAHDKHKAKDPKAKNGKDSGPLTATVNGRKVTITDDDAPMEDPIMSRPTPIQARGIDADKITLGDGFLKPSVSRGELRRFKDYEGRLEGRIDGLARVADATKALAAQAEQQATDCRELAEQAKGVEGGEKLVGTLNKLADQAKAQAHQAEEVHKQAIKAHDFAKAVLSNIQTRYQPLYQAVVDSDEVKPAELKFYADRGVLPTALAA
ncbi:hypothetical protein ACGFNY_43880 [Streptomyces chartreusis]|uniref:hypothetical protein n=1 Tax=Streptomyces chartreusis TaxID=1969 RepID=UPI0037182A25